MPIDIDRFKESPEDTLRGGGETNAERILGFLSRNDSQAFTPKEIHEGTGVARGSVGVVLSRLKERGLVTGATTGHSKWTPTLRRRWSDTPTTHRGSDGQTAFVHRQLTDTISLL
jgi:hypothetical protein